MGKQEMAGSRKKRDGGGRERERERQYMYTNLYDIDHQYFRGHPGIHPIFRKHSVLVTLTHVIIPRNLIYPLLLTLFIMNQYGLFVC